MTISKQSLASKACPKCGQQNRASFHCCHYCGYVFPKPRKKLKLSRADIGMIVGAILGLGWGILRLWDLLGVFGIIGGLLSGGYVGYGLAYGPKFDAQIAVIGCVVGAILGLLDVLVKQDTATIAQPFTTVVALAVISGILWKDMFVGTRNIRIAGIVGAIVGILFMLIIIKIPQSNDVTIGMQIITMFEVGMLGALAGVGVVYEPWTVLTSGVFIGVLSWYGFQFDPRPIIELPQKIVWGLWIASAGNGARHIPGR